MCILRCLIWKCRKGISELDNIVYMAFIWQFFSLLIQCWTIKILLMTKQPLQIPWKIMSILPEVTLANNYSAQTVLCFFLLMLYKISPCKIVFDYCIYTIFFLFILDKFVVFLSWNCKSNTPLRSVRMNFNGIKEFWCKGIKCY